MALPRARNGVHEELVPRKIHRNHDAESPLRCDVTILYHRQNRHKTVSHANLPPEEKRSNPDAHVKL
jgi:hypothetical protein